MTPMSNTISREQALSEIRKLPESNRFVLVEQGLERQYTFSESVSTQSKDFDFWSPIKNRELICSAIQELGGYRVCCTTSKKWLNHDIYLMPCTDGILQIDITLGDLKVGPVTLATEELVFESLSGKLKLSGFPLIADLLLRPMARGSHVIGERLNCALEAWHVMDEVERSQSREHAKRFLGGHGAKLMEGVLDGTYSQRHLVRWLKLLTVLRGLTSFTSSRILLRKITSNLLSKITGRNKPFGRYHRGLLVVLSGTDGVGKSSTVQGLITALNRQEMRTDVYYLGRGRENLPGTHSLRKFVGEKIQKSGKDNDIYKFVFVNKAVSWYYALEYSVRTIGPMINAKLLGKIVLCDRYLYDIQLIPNYSTTAFHFVRAICPRPDINVFLWAPETVIRSRKKERTTQVISEQQAVFARMIESRYARLKSMSINTHSTSLANVCSQVVMAINKGCHISYV